jgi:hypothetical protein
MCPWQVGDIRKDSKTLYFGGKRGSIVRHIFVARLTENDCA